MKKIIILFLFCINCYSGVYFDGTDDYINIGTACRFTTENFSISAIIKFSDIVDSTILFAGMINQYGFYFIIDHGAPDILLSTNGSNTEVWANNNLVSTNVITQVGFTRNGTVGKLYVNGTEVTYQLQQSIVDMVISSTPTLIGRYGQSSNNNWCATGQISELAVWQSALTVNEMYLLANSKVKGTPKQIQPSALKLYLPLDDFSDGTSGDGKVYKDLSGNNNTGTGNDGANNIGLTNKAEEILTYP